MESDLLTYKLREASHSVWLWQRKAGRARSPYGCLTVHYGLSSDAPRASKVRADASLECVCSQVRSRFSRDKKSPAYRKARTGGERFGEAGGQPTDAARRRGQRAHVDGVSCRRHNYDDRKARVRSSNPDPLGTGEGLNRATLMPRTTLLRSAPSCRECTDISKQNGGYDEQRPMVRAGNSLGHLFNVSSQLWAI